jgi:hypothetical protein
MARNEALRKAIFDSVLATTSYRAGKAVVLPDLNCEQVHFALNQVTNRQIMGNYLRWFIALKLLTVQENAAFVKNFIDGGPSTCVLRTSFGNAECDSMFFDGDNHLRPPQYYLEFGRQALRALLDPEHQAIDQLRYKIVDDALWPTALSIGANVNLGPLVGLGTSDAKVDLLIGDVLVITEWAKAMTEAGAFVQDMRTFVSDSNVATLFENKDFKRKRDALQQKMAAIVKASGIRFDEPWGMVCLFWSCGSPKTAYGKIVAKRLTVERGTQPALSVAAH